MNRISILSFIVVLGGTAALIATTAQSQVGPPKNYVSLQPTTPGTSQSGHANVSGTMRASQFIGGGSGLSNVNADLLDGLNSTAFLTAIPNPLLLSGTQNGLPIIRGSNASTSSSSIGILGEITSTSPGGFSAAVSGVNSGTGGSGIGVAGSQNGSGWGMFGVSVSGIGVLGYSSATSGLNRGVFGQTSSPNGVGVDGDNFAATGTAYGVRGTSSSTSGEGVLGYASSTTGTNFGVHGVSDSVNGRGVYGEATHSVSNSYGVYGSSVSQTGSGVFAINTHANGGIAIIAHATAGSLTSVGTGVFATTNSPNGNGMYGRNDATIDGGWGIRGASMGPDGRGVFGQAFAATGNSIGVYGQSDSNAGKGVYGIATLSTGTIYGVYGAASTAAAGFAVFANGDMGASGLKPFRIDHPTDPENKYLLHYAAESPFPQNFYCGNVTTDSNGKAWVELPDYFSAINVEFKYQLTVVDDSESSTFVQAKIGRKVQGNRFLVMTSSPNVEVSWEVKANRNDLRVQTNRPKDVIEKTLAERGKYQQPEYYGMPLSRGVDFAPVTSRTSSTGK